MLVENRGHSRIYAATVAGVVTWLMGLLTVFSFNIASNFKPLSSIGKFENSTMFDLLDYLTSNIMLPLGGLLIAIFVGWLMSKDSSMEELNIQDRAHMGYRIWLLLVKFVAPLAVIIVFLKVTGIIDFLISLLK